MNNRSIAWWLRQIGLPQYTKPLETACYGLEGLLNITDADLKVVGVDDPNHRARILYQLQKHSQKLQLGTTVPATTAGRVTRKLSLGSSLDLGKSKKDLFRQSIVPRLRRHNNHRISSSCTQLRSQDQVVGLDDQDSSSSLKDKNSKRKSVIALLHQMFGGRKDMAALKKELEEELKLNTEDLRSHAWYHGQLQRESAEELLENDGEFLVRDSRSSEGDYVMTCRWKDQALHYKIIRVVLRPKQGYSRELFQFEDDQFDNVPALVRYHVGGRRPVSYSSGAIIIHPITRTLPLRVISEHQAAKEASQRSGDQNKRRSLSSSDAIQANNLLRSGSQPANLETVGRPSLQSAQSDSNLRTGVPQKGPCPIIDPAPISPVFRTGSDPLLSPGSARPPRPSQSGAGSTLRGSDGQLHPRAPPKPLRISALFPGIPPFPRAPAVDPASFYEELVPKVPVSMLPKGHAARLRAEEKWQSRARLTETSFGFLEASETHLQQQGATAGTKKEVNQEEEWQFSRPQIEMETSFQLDAFHSLLLPEGNRPLEQSTLLKIKEIFTRTDATATALHMLSVDCQVARVTGVTEEQRRLMGVESGLELITLPHGGQLRQDLLERHHLIALGVAVDILGCTGTVNQRATVLHKVIQLANALRHTAGDLYGFSAVMAALEMPQVTRLEMTWKTLRHNHTESAVLFEKQLKTLMKALNDGDDSAVVGSLALPHIVPLLKLMEGEESGEESERGCALLYNILQSARKIALNANLYKQHATSLLTTGWEPIPELLEAFRTEFALRLFWGQTGASAGRTERYEKFDKILTVLSKKLEPMEGSEL